MSSARDEDLVDVEDVLYARIRRPDKVKIDTVEHDATLIARIEREWVDRGLIQ